MGNLALPSKQVWKIDPAIDVDRVSLEDVKLIFSQAEKVLDDTVKTGESIASKTMSVITLMAGVFIALSGFMIANWGSSTPATKKDYLAIFGCCYLLAMFVYTIRNVLPDKYLVPGSEPEQLMVPSFFAATVPKEKITLFIYISEIENYNLRIEKNLEMNDRRWKRYRRSVILFLIFPILLGALYCLLEWLG
jgi:hypothetical protein